MDENQSETGVLLLQAVPVLLQGQLLRLLLRQAVTV